MHLGSFNSATKHYDSIRKLRRDEVADHKNICGRLSKRAIVLDFFGC